MKTTERGRNQIDSQEIQRYASFLAQNGGLQVSEDTQHLNEIKIIKQFNYVCENKHSLMEDLTFISKINREKLNPQIKFSRATLLSIKNN